VILWALAAGIVVWGEWPDAVALAGIVIVTAAGVYTFHRERLRSSS
jgi:drug/metabolite transporter (DMT)-like permease